MQIQNGRNVVKLIKAECCNFFGDTLTFLARQKNAVSFKKKSVKCLSFVIRGQVFSAISHWEVVNFFIIFKRSLSPKAVRITIISISDRCF
jgi:hypothetical protein